MDFKKPEPIDILVCTTCNSTGRMGFTRCSGCGGMEMGVYKRGKWLFWDFPLTRYHLALTQGRHILDKIRLITALVFGLTFWIWCGFYVYKSGAYKFLLDPQNIGQFFPAFTPRMIVFFCLGAVGFLYLWYRIIRGKEFAGIVEKFQYDYEANKRPKDEGVAVNSWQQAVRISRRKRFNIARAFTTEALTSLGDAYHLADSKGHKSVLPEHLFYALLSSNRIGNIFIRLGIPASVIKEQLDPFFRGQAEPGASPSLAPSISNEFRQIIFQSYEDAYDSHQEYVSVTELLEAAVANSDKIQEILFDLGVKSQKLVNVIEWARIKEKLYRQYLQLRRASARHSKHGMDKAMTALATPYLNQFSDDLTLQAHFGYLDACVARSKEIEEIYRVVEGGQHNVILVGEHGVGKKSIVEGVAQSMVSDDVPARLKDKRLVRLSVSALLAGTTPAGAVDRLRNIMSEIARARNIILFIHNIHELAGVSAGGAAGSLDVADTLAEFLGGGKFLTFATTTNEDYARQIANSTLGNVFTKVDVAEMNEDQAIQVLEAKVGETEYKQQVFFAYDGIEKAVKLAAKFIRETSLPGNALEIMNEAGSYAKSAKGVNSLVTAEEVAAVVAQKTKIPMTTVSSDESTKLMQLEEEMHKRVIGQEEAVDLVANALRRARAEIRSANRPIANFLFMGPTGVGKTELAKTIAEVYFGGEERMIRLDMSEYQDKSGIYRLIGSPAEKGTGLLTEAVRRSPFALLLLDEIEKADPDILNLFLQVMDDGRLTDSVGRVVDFTNVIIIATTNAGTSQVQEMMRAGLSSDVIKDRLLHGDLKQYFRPEFLNRFDGIVLFKALEREDIKKIAGLMIKRIIKDMEAKGVTLKVEDAALDFLADVGFDPEFGARPMRRALQERVENKLAELYLSGGLKRRDTVIVGEGGNIRVE
jgi:ATP-dependent Clp protease ATP-binding subunit ClpC